MISIISTIKLILMLIVIIVIVMTIMQMCGLRQRVVARVLRALFGVLSRAGSVDVEYKESRRGMVRPHRQDLYGRVTIFAIYFLGKHSLGNLKIPRLYVCFKMFSEM